MNHRNEKTKNMLKFFEKMGGKKIGLSQKILSYSVS